MSYKKRSVKASVELLLQHFPAVMIHVRVDEELKKEATQALESMGLSVSDAVRVFLTRIAKDQAFPFSIKVPNAETQQAMMEARALTQGRFNSSEDLINALESAVNRK